MSAIPSNLKLKMAMAASAGVIAMAVPFVSWFEGRSLVAYLDPVGTPTICDGWTFGVRLGDIATPQECDEKTVREVSDALYIVDSAVPYTLPAGARIAFTSFVVNVGPGRKGVKDGFVWLKSGRHSTIWTMLQVQNVVGACNQLPLWANAGGKRFDGLVNRRAVEREVCLLGLTPDADVQGAANVVG